MNQKLHENLERLPFESLAKQKEETVGKSLTAWKNIRPVLDDWKYFMGGEGKTNTNIRWISINISSSLEICL